MRMERTGICMRYIAAACCAFALFLSAGCAADSGEISSSSENQAKTKCTRTVYAMDTVMDLTVYGDEEILDEAETLIGDLEAKLSVTDSGSEIYKLNHEKEAAVSNDTAELILRALELCERTDGALNISIYPIVAEWGFTTGNFHVPDETVIAGLLKNTDYSAIRVERTENGSDVISVVSVGADMSVDLGSVAKGYTGDRISARLREKGVASALLNLGGNVQAVGEKPDGSAWRIAIADPQSSGTYLGSVEIIDKAVITSGGYQRYFEENGVQYHHIIDPSTGYPAAGGLISVTIVGDSGLEGNFSALNGAKTQVIQK